MSRVHKEPEELLVLPVQSDIRDPRGLPGWLEFRVLLVQRDYQAEEAREECLDLQAAQVCIVEVLVPHFFRLTSFTFLSRSRKVRPPWAIDRTKTANAKTETLRFKTDAKTETLRFKTEAKIETVRFKTEAKTETLRFKRDRGQDRDTAFQDRDQHRDTAFQDRRQDIDNVEQGQRRDT